MYVKDVEDGVCGFYAILHTEVLLLNFVTHVEGVKDVKYYVLYSGIQRPLTPTEGKAIY